MMRATPHFNVPYFKWLTLFISSSTLLCCALPILLVSLGFGAAMASLNYNIPALVFIAEHQFWMLILSAGFLLFLARFIWKSQQSCPADPELAKYCQITKHWNKRVFWLSIAIWCIGFFFSVLLQPLRILWAF